MTEHRASLVQKLFLKFSVVSCLKSLWKFVLIISLNLVLIFLVMPSLVSILFWCFSRFLAFCILLSIAIWIVRRSFLNFLSLTRAFTISTQFVDLIFAALLSLLIIWKKISQILYLSVHSKSVCNMVSLFVLQLLQNGVRLILLYALWNIFWFTYKTRWSILKCCFRGAYCRNWMCFPISTSTTIFSALCYSTSFLKWFRIFWCVCLQLFRKYSW